MQKINVRLCAAAVAVAAIALPLSAQATGSCTTERKAKWMQDNEVSKQLEKQGYQVKRVKTEGNCYEVYALDKSGKRHEMVVNPMDGKPVSDEGNE
ncbi:PepSY domain-containing protein [Paraburkholderia sp. SIMBA_055]